MAGIGFELKKLFNKDDGTVSSDTKATIYSTIIGLGPWIITTVTLNILNFIAKLYIPLRSERNLFITSVIYTFIFSQIFMGPFQYSITRYLSDRIYSDESKEIKGALIGVLKTIFTITFLGGYLFLRSSPLPSYFKYVEIILFSITTMIWLVMIFIGILKSYNFIIIAYLVGNITAVILGISFFKFEIFKELRSFSSFPLLLAYTIGMLITFFMSVAYLMSILKEESKSEFDFLNYYNGYLSLGVIGTLFTMGSWAHIAINWMSESTYLVGGTFMASPLYEIITFYSSIIVMPTMVYFFVFLETNFFDYYTEYYRALIGYGDKNEIEKKRKSMIDVLKKQILYCMELQFFISLSSAIIANIIFEKFGMDLYYIDLFRIMIFGSYCSVFISIYLILLLYFDARKESVTLCLIFVLTNVGLGYLFFKLGPSYSGMGYFSANFLTLLFSSYILDSVLEKLNFQTFYRQNFKIVIGNAFLNWMEHFFNKKGYFLVILIILFFASN